jgi:hypothetical protein
MILKKKGCHWNDSPAASSESIGAIGKGKAEGKRRVEDRSIHSRPIRRAMIADKDQPGPMGHKLESI